MREMCPRYIRLSECLDFHWLSVNDVCTYSKAGVVISKIEVKDVRVDARGEQSSSGGGSERRKRSSSGRGEIVITDKEGKYGVRVLNVQRVNYMSCSSEISQDE